MTRLIPDETEVRAFCEAIHAQARSAFDGVANPGLLQMFRINPEVEKDTRIFRFTIGDVDGMTAQAVADAKAGYNVYVEGRTVKPTLSRNSRGTAAFDTIGVFALVVDSDGDKGKGATAPALEPSMIVESSPGNEHHWYFLDRAQPFSVANKLGRGLRAGTGADSDTGNLAQPYRVAGTPNFVGPHKRERGRTPSATFIREQSGLVYSADQFSAAYPYSEPAKAESSPPPRDANAITPSLSEFRRWQLSLPREEIPNQDRSAHFFNVSGFLKGDGFTIDEVEEIWRQFPDGAAEKYLAPRDRLRTILESDWPKLKDTPPEPFQLATIGGRAIDPQSGRYVDQADGEDDGPQFSVGGDWTRPGGVLEDIADWILATSRRPNRPLAVAAAISIVATVCGRHIATPTISGTQLYIACIGETAIGKDRPMKAIKKVMVDAGIPHLAQTGKFMSVSAVEDAVADFPCHVAVVDEIGKSLFARMTHRRASTHEGGIAGALLELWSSSFDVFQTSRRAQSSAREIHSPCFSIFGVSTTETFYNSVGIAAVENGLLNRFLLIKAAKRSAPVDVDPDTLMKTPRHITDAILSLLPPSGGNLVMGAAAFGDQGQPKPLVVPWASDEVRASYMAMENEILAMMDANPEVAPYLGRTAEMSVRLATVYAVSRFGRDAMVTKEALQWGRMVATQSAQAMLDDVRDNLYENDYQAKYKMVEKIVREAGEITRRDLMRKLNGRISKLDVGNIIGSLEDAGQVREEKVTRGARLVWLRRKSA